MWEKVIQETERISKETDFSGVISITKDHETVYQKAHGYADIANKRKTEPIRFLHCVGNQAFYRVGNRKAY